MSFFLFPGQGSQKTAMGQDFFEQSAVAKAVLDEANSLFGKQNEAWFEFDVVGTSSAGVDQTITLTARNLQEGGNFTAEIEDLDDTSGGAAPPPLVSRTTHRFVSPMGPGSTGSPCASAPTPDASAGTGRPHAHGDPAAGQVKHGFDRPALVE